MSDITKTFEIKFRHFRTDTPSARAAQKYNVSIKSCHPEALWRRVFGHTVCTIAEVVVVDGKRYYRTAARGMALCSVADIFCRRKGRNVAFRRAFEALQEKGLVLDAQAESGDPDLSIFEGGKLILCLKKYFPDNKLSF